LISIAITGPECSGKTSLAKELSTFFGSALVVEYSRIFLGKINRPYKEHDLVDIAQGQQDLFAMQVLLNPSIIVNDTDMSVIQIWSEAKYHRISPALQSILDSAKQHHYYLLCYPDLPWEDDPLRESKNGRLALFDLYFKHLEANNLPYSVIRGMGKQRSELAISIIQEKFGL